ncbi:hypothetical protein DS901_16740 [Loktanella sp. D2R18]|nr:hypothetical protein DS901_16740 [Loktanella sp. D2R18]
MPKRSAAATAPRTSISPPITSPIRPPRRNRTSIFVFLIALYGPSASLYLSAQQYRHIPMKQPEQSVETDKVLRFAHRFEEIVIIILYGVIALITIFALIRLALAIFDAAFTSWDVKNVYSLQVLFAMVLTVLIALELGNTILRHLREHSTIVQAQEIILIGMMAVVRKIMLIDLSTVSAGLLAALASVALALSAAYWFTRKMDER